ncbi:MAG: hypothetical protein JW959_05145 [Pirellulales bacterium]|nr:hypothetical protein [Pirellulales bacterium]
MLSSIRTIVFALASGAAAAALAGDAYYDVPIRELKLTEGELPSRETINQWRPYDERERLLAMWPYVVLDGPGEAYVVGRGTPRDTWYAPYLPELSPSTYTGPPPAPAPAGAAPPPPQATVVPPSAGTGIYILAPEGKEVTGRLYVPNADLTGMIALKFAVPASAAKAESKPPFLWAKMSHYESLRNRDIPGGAWFRHQANSIQRRQPAEGRASSWPATRFNRDDIGQTYELFAGGRALSENLQLDRALPEQQANETPVKLDTLKGITIEEIDWEPLIGDKRPELDPLAAKIPADQHAVFFPSFQAAMAVLDETERHDTPVLRLARPRSENARIVDRYQRQLGLKLSEIARLLGPKVVRSMALTGSDPYYPLGTDVAVLFESPQPEVLESLLRAKIALAAGQMKDIKFTTGEINGLGYRGFLTPDRSLCSYIARLDGAVVATNSIYQLERLAAVEKGEAKSIAALPEYKFFRVRYPLGAADETALVFIGDPTIRRWRGPRWRIADSRRTRARALLADIQAGQLDALVRKTVRPGPIHTEYPTLDGELTLTDSGVVSSTCGTLEFMTPIAELPLEEVTKAEAEAYRRWRDGYERNWNWAFDPIALKIGLGENRLSADLSVMPLIIGTRYASFTSLALGGSFKPTDGDRHDALAQFIMAINHDAPMFQYGNNLASTMGKAVSLGWLGRWVNVYADDDPFWRELAEVESDEINKFMEKNVGRLPAAVRFDAPNPLKLAAFLTGVRAFIEQTAPGLTQWESLKYREQPYVRIAPATGKREIPKEMEKLTVFYTTVDNALTITLNEKVLCNSIDRSLDRKKATAEKSEKAAPRPWLGSNVALRVDSKILEIANAAHCRRYEEAMRMKCWNNLPILNEWKRLYPDRDPVEVHRRVWGVELLCPGGGKYIWNDKYRAMESTVYGHPGEPKQGPAAPPVLSDFSSADFGLTFEHKGLRAQAVLERAGPTAENN